MPSYIPKGYKLTGRVQQRGPQNYIVGFTKNLDEITFIQRPPHDNKVCTIPPQNSLFSHYVEYTIVGSTVACGMTTQTPDGNSERMNTKIVDSIQFIIKTINDTVSDEEVIKMLVSLQPRMMLVKVLSQ